MNFISKGSDEKFCSELAPGIGTKAVLLILMGMPTLLMAQAFKCTVDGKVVYQGVACDGGDKVNLMGAGKADPTSQEATYWKKEGSRLARKEKIEAAINSQQIMVGMTSEEVLQSWGKPSKINRTVTRNEATEQWVYERKTIVDTQYVYLRNGVVSSMQSPQ